ncbi:MAG TPA: hypothetical protein VLZ84_06160 [Asticcacaulis sp.]|nr:hypothetical protein [Asticcacaulis sp.]
MLNITRYIASIVIPVSFLAILSLTAYKGQHDGVMKIAGAAPLLVMLMGWIMPRKNNFWSWICGGLAVLIAAVWIWFYLIS